MSFTLNTSVETTLKPDSKVVTKFSFIIYFAQFIKSMQRK